MKLAFSTATALALLMGTAYAGGNNEAYLYQDGAFNSASVDQSGGSDNDAGSAAQNIIQRRTNDPDQTGDTLKSNVLTIEQSGSHNAIGLGVNGNNFGHAAGVYQDEDYSQTSHWGSQKNIIDIIQSSDHNTVGAVSQYTATHVGNNSLTVTQGGGGFNIVGSVSQHRTQTTENVAVIDQTGDHNTVARVEQYARLIGVPGATKNDLDVKMSGANNGNGALTGFALGSGAQSSTLIQGGPGALAARGSYAHLDISGDDNQFGVTQYGERNSVGTLTILGDSNEVGTYQQGNDNTIALAQVGGLGNNIGIRQTGNDNLATTIVDGDDNEASVSQYSLIGPYDMPNTAFVDIDGDGNWTRIKQVYGSDAHVTVDGGDNDIAIDQYIQAAATVTFTGDNNAVSLNQLNGATATVTITGDDNNRGGFAGGITSALASSTTSGLGAPMQVGGIIQNGASDVSITVGSLGPSDGNRFSFNQGGGSGNSIVGLMNGVGGNEAVVSQVGAGNVTNFAQNGGTNLLAVSQ
jgi:hypothetical protein